MKDKINVAELLKDCPKGMELDCTCADNVVFDKIIEYEQIKCVIGECRDPLILDKYGRLIHICCPKCVIFPKGKTTWEGFQRPFADGDVVALDSVEGTQLFIFKEYVEKEENRAECYVMMTIGGTISLLGGTYYIKRLATEEEKQKLFDAIKDHGYKWNAETKTLEKLIEPKFKVGDIVKSKNCPTAGNFVIVGIEEDNYSINLKNYCIKFKDQDNYELINKPKFKVGDRIEFKYHERSSELVVKVKDNGYAVMLIGR